MTEKDELRKYTADDIPNIIENMTEDHNNPVPGTEVTQTPGLIPETPTAIPGLDPNRITPQESDEYDPPKASISAHDRIRAGEEVDTESAVGYPREDDNNFAPDGRLLEIGESIPYSGEGTDMLKYPPQFTSSISGKTMDKYGNPLEDIQPTGTEHPNSENAHKELLNDASYAVHMHEHQLNKVTQIISEMCARIIALEEAVAKLSQDASFPDSDNPIKDYPEVQAHQNRA